MRSRIAVILCAAEVLAFFPRPSIGQWVNLGGPGGCGVQALAANGSYLFVGTAFGIFVSTDDGGSWNAAGEVGSAALGQAAITSLVISAADLYACTSRGVFLSTDYGATWTSVPTDLPVDQVAGGLLEAGSFLYLSVWGGGVRRSADRGTHWMPVGEGIFDDSDLSSLAVLGEVVYAGLDYADNVYYSKDKGLTWVPLDPKLPDQAAVKYVVASGRRLLAGTSSNGIFMIEDGGTAWTKVGTDWGESAGAEFLAAKGPNVLAGIDDKAYLSTDSGTTWKKVEIGRSPDDLRVSSFAVNGPRLFVGTAEDGLFRSDDLGVTWTPVNANLPSQAMMIDIARIGTDLFGGTRKWGGGGSVFIRADGGAGWEPAGSGLPEEGYINCLEAVGTKLLAGTDKGIFFSENRGRSWRLTGPDEPEPAAVSCFEVVGRSVIAGTSGGVLLSTDQGRSWSAAKEGLPESVAVNCLETFGTLLFAGTFRGIFVSRDRGETWGPIVADALQDAHCESIATVGKTLAAGIFPRKEKSVGGRPLDDTNKLILNIPEEPIIDVLGYTKHAILLSGDEGRSWAEVVEGLPDGFIVSCLAASGSNLFAALENRYKGGRSSLGTFLSRDGGVSWTSEWPGQWRATPINRLRVAKDGIYAATEGAGVWRLPLSALKKPVQ
jgi:photosystem II stability/assembly factor-like uncharacterized protein